MDSFFVYLDEKGRPVGQSLRIYKSAVGSSHEVIEVDLRLWAVVNRGISGVYWEQGEEDNGSL